MEPEISVLLMRLKSVTLTKALKGSNPANLHDCQWELRHWEVLIIYLQWLTGLYFGLPCVMIMTVVIFITFPEFLKYVLLQATTITKDASC